MSLTIPSKGKTHLSHLNVENSFGAAGNRPVIDDL